MGRSPPRYLVITPTQAFMSRDSPLNESLCELVKRARYTYYDLVWFYSYYGYTYYGCRSYEYSLYFGWHQVRPPSCTAAAILTTYYGWCTC